MEKRPHFSNRELGFCVFEDKLPDNTKELVQFVPFFKAQRWPLNVRSRTELS